jgi:tetratricopeptide (TPR) repeat protein
MGNAFLIILFPLLFILLNITDTDNESKRIDFLAETTEYNGDYSVVKQNCDEIIRLSEKIRRVDYMLVGYYTLCWSAEHHGKIEDLHSYVADGMKLLNRNYEDLSSSDSGKMIMSNMIIASGLYYYSLGNFNQAIEVFLKIVPPDKKPLTQRSDILFSVYSYLGQSYFNSGYLDKSIRYFELAKRYNQTPEDFTYSEALYFLYRAQYEHSTGEIGKAFVSLKNAIPLLENDPRKLHVRRALKSAYLLYASYCKTNYDSAVYFVKKSMSLFSENDQDFINGYRLLGDIYYTNSKTDSALLCYYKSIEFSNRIYWDVHHTKARSYCGIANILRDHNTFDKALHY